jgi:hypothetical protein
LIHCGILLDFPYELCLRYILPIYQCDNISYIYFKFTCNLHNIYLTHYTEYFELFHEDGRTGRHDAANSLFTILRTCLTEHLHVLTSCFQRTCKFLSSVCVQLTPATDRHRSPITAFSPTHPLLNHNKSTSLPSVPQRRTEHMQCEHTAGQAHTS